MLFLSLCSNQPASNLVASQFSFAIGYSWSFNGASPCPGGSSTCYNVESVGVSPSDGATEVNGLHCTCPLHLLFDLTLCSLTVGAGGVQAARSLFLPQFQVVWDQSPSPTRSRFGNITKSKLLTTYATLANTGVTRVIIIMIAGIPMRMVGNVATSLTRPAGV